VTACANGCHGRPDDDGNRHPIQADDRSQVCRRCEDRMLDWLEKIPQHYALLPEFIEHGSVDRNPESKSTKASVAQAPMRLDVIDLLDERRGRKWAGTAPADAKRGTLGVLADPAQRVREAKNITHPARTTVASEAATLRRHLLWVAEQDWGIDVYADLQTLHRQLADAVGDYRPRPVGICQAVTEDGDCGGPLMPSRYHVGVQCPRCGAQWSETDLQRLGLVIGGERA